MNKNGSPLLRELVALCTAPGTRGGGKGDKTISSGKHRLEWHRSERTNAATHMRMQAGKP